MPRGFALLFVVLLLLGVSLTATVVVVSTSFFSDNNAYTQTRLTLREVGLAISNKSITPAPLYQRAYELDVGALPGTLADLQTKPGAVAACAYSGPNMFVTGWCGPYVTNTYAGQTSFVDAWGRALDYDSAGRRVYSWGANGADDAGVGDDVVQAF